MRIKVHGIPVEVNRRGAVFHATGIARVGNTIHEVIGESSKMVGAVYHVLNQIQDMESRS